MELKRKLNLLDVFSFTTGSMISAGLFMLPGLAHLKAGPAAALSYLLAGLLAATAMLSAAELATFMPRAGGVYYFVSRGLGYSLGMAAGLARWFSMSLNSAFALLGVGALSSLFFDLPAIPVAVTCCLIFIVVNILGVKITGRLQTFLLAGLLGILVFYVLRGLPAVEAARLTPFFPSGFAAVLAASGFVFISYGGLLSVIGLAEEVKIPERTIPRGLLLSLLVTAVLYFGVVLVTVGVVDAELLHSAVMPVAQGAGAFFGPQGVIVLVIGALLAFVTTSNAGIAAASRYLLAMGRDGVLPGSFTCINQRCATPHYSVLFTGVFVLAVIIFVSLQTLIEIASTLLILSYILTNLTLVKFRMSKDPGYNPRFRSPFFPWLQLTGIAGLTLLIIQTGWVAVITAATTVTTGAIWHDLYIATTKKRPGDPFR